MGRFEGTDRYIATEDLKVAVNAAVADTLSAAQALVIARFGEVTLADIAQDFDRRFAQTATK